MLGNGEQVGTIRVMKLIRAGGETQAKVWAQDFKIKEKQTELK